MFPSSGLFRKIDCPFAGQHLCHRSYCHYRHVHVRGDVQPTSTLVTVAESTVPSYSPTPLAELTRRERYLPFAGVSATTRSASPQDAPSAQVEPYDPRVTASYVAATAKDQLTDNRVSPPSHGEQLSSGQQFHYAETIPHGKNYYADSCDSMFERPKATYPPKGHSANRELETVALLAPSSCSTHKEQTSDDTTIRIMEKSIEKTDQNNQCHDAPSEINKEKFKGNISYNLSTEDKEDCERKLKNTTEVMKVTEKEDGDETDDGDNDHKPRDETYDVLSKTFTQMSLQTLKENTFPKFTARDEINKSSKSRMTPGYEHEDEKPQNKITEEESMKHLDESGGDVENPNSLKCANLGLRVLKSNTSPRKQQQKLDRKHKGDPINLESELGKFTKIKRKKENSDNMLEVKSTSSVKHHKERSLRSLKVQSSTSQRDQSIPVTNNKHLKSGKKSDKKVTDSTKADHDVDVKPKKKLRNKQQSDRCDSSNDGRCKRGRKSKGGDNVAQIESKKTVKKGKNKLKKSPKDEIAECNTQPPLKESDVGKTQKIKTKHDGKYPQKDRSRVLRPRKCKHVSKEEFQRLLKPGNVSQEEVEEESELMSWAEESDDAMAAEATVVGKTRKTSPLQGSTYRDARPAKTRVARKPDAYVRTKMLDIMSATRRKLLDQPSQMMLVRGRTLKKHNENMQATLARTQAKGRQRVAHTLPSHLEGRPVAHPVTGLKIPLCMRQKKLDLLFLEHLKLYDPLDSCKLATDKERDVCEESRTAIAYCNLINRVIVQLRKTIEEKVKTLKFGKVKGKVKGNVSKEKDQREVIRVRNAMIYKKLLPHVLTKDELIENGFPQGDQTRSDGAAVKLRYGDNEPVLPNCRRCARCRLTYSVDELGHQTSQQKCVHHEGKIWRGRYRCCDGDCNLSAGCTEAPRHVCSNFQLGNYGFRRARPPPSTTGRPAADDDHGVYAIDCEMCYTIVGIDLVRVTMVDRNCKVVLDKLVTPSHDVLDYNTTYSGISEANLKGVKTTVFDAQREVLRLVNQKTILVGHSLDSDLRALKLIHETVVDTSVAYPHSQNRKYSLKALAHNVLQKVIQDDESGHNSFEDAVTAMELMLFKIGALRSATQQAASSM